jgi:2-amino-4-hydroxy-6-hydroxymethyldihydropteridine diphosphokinase
MVHLNEVFLLLGSNIEPRLNYLEEAIQNIGLTIGDIITKSSVYTSKPMGFVSDQQFLNQVIVVSSSLSRDLVLSTSLEIEKKMGRTRNNDGYSSRTIDIDLLYYNKDIMESPYLTIPHPRLHERMFTLVPLTELCPDFIHPKLNMDHETLLKKCLDDSEVSKFNN